MGISEFVIRLVHLKLSEKTSRKRGSGFVFLETDLKKVKGCYMGQDAQCQNWDQEGRVQFIEKELSGCQSRPIVEWASWAGGEDMAEWPLGGMLERAVKFLKEEWTKWPLSSLPTLRVYDF